MISSDHAEQSQRDRSPAARGAGKILKFLKMNDLCLKTHFHVNARSNLSGRQWTLVLAQAVV
jgi:hypothetical protein